jgi:cytidylate kinase
LPGEQRQTVIVDGQDVSEAIRTPQISQFTSEIAQISEIRQILVRMQQELAIQKGVVMDGRDIGTHVLPNAELKLYLTASVEERARRRYEELVSQSKLPQSMSLADIQADIAARDHMDQTRDVSPLVQAADALLIDSSTMTIDEVVDTITKLIYDQLAARAQ